MNIIFQIDGGLGKSIAATAVCKVIKATYPQSNLIVISGYPDVFLCNPNVYKVFGHHELRYFYSTYIENQEVKLMLHNPYFDTQFIKRESHLIEVWCNLFGLEYKGEQPELFINQREIQFFSQQFISDKPIFLLQTNGGPADQINKYSWARDIPTNIAQDVVNIVSKTHNVYHVKREDQIGLNNTYVVNNSFRAICALILLSDKRLLIDSFIQHAAAALKKKSVVCWIANTPKQFGYEIHSNVLANEFTAKPELRNSFLSPFNISGDPLEFPYRNEQEIFDTARIIDAFNPTPPVVANNELVEPEVSKTNKRK